MGRRFRRSGRVPDWWIVLQICEFIGMVGVAGAIARMSAEGVDPIWLWALGLGAIAAVFVLNGRLKRRFLFRDE